MRGRVCLFVRHLNARSHHTQKPCSSSPSRTAFGTALFGAGLTALGSYKVSQIDVVGLEDRDFRLQNNEGQVCVCVCVCVWFAHRDQRSLDPLCGDLALVAHIALSF